MSEIEQAEAPPGPDEIRQFTPPVRRHGYDRATVDAFISRLAQALEQRERLIGETLLVAQQAAHEVRAAAERDAEAIRAQADAAAKETATAATAKAGAQLEYARRRVAQFEAEASRRKAAHEEEMERLGSFADSARREMVGFLNEALGRLAATDAKPTLAPVAPVKRSAIR